MIQLWRHRPLKQKLIAITMLASTSALLFAAAAFVLYDMRTYQQTLANDLLIRVKVLEINNAAPLAFQDAASARENLAPLRADPRLAAAVIYDKTGALFADYRRSPEMALPPNDLGGEPIRFTGDHVDLSLPVWLDREVIGHIALRADLTEWHQRLRTMLLISIGVLLASCGMAFVIASRLQTAISGPIADLTRVAHRVSRQKDYTVQAVKRGDDEIGSLADGLNEMLTQIHERDRRLQHYSETLERQVVERTADLSRANDTLRESETRYRHLVDHAQDIICRVDAQGRFVYFNPTVMRFTQYSADELQGRNCLDLVRPDARAAARRFYRRQFLRRIRATSYEVPLVAKDGTEVWVSQNVQMLLDHDRVVGFQAIARDITERKQVENALQQAHNELERLVEHRTAELRETVERLSTEISDREQAEAALRLSQDQIRQMQKMEAIGQLAGGIAHDFNNILTAILGNADLAFAKLDREHEACLNLTRILEAGQRASHLVQQILTFTHQQEVSRAVLALPSVVNEVLELLRATLPAGIELTTRYDPETPAIWADATQIHQVLMNLCTNAWHALEESPGRISVELAAVTLTQSLHSLHATLGPGRYARLSVSDTGCGMSSETVERIYDPFFTTKPVGQGTGLGLSVVHGIVSGHEGAIVVDSHLGLGTTFHLYFPAVDQLSSVDKCLDMPGEPSLECSCHLLYLDDEEMLVELVRALLEPAGYRVSGFTNATEAVGAVQADPGHFDVIVTDYNMPGMSGVEVARVVEQVRADLPIVLVSGYLTPTEHEHALGGNVKAIIYKPVMLHQLRDVVARLIRHSHQD